MKKFVLTGVIGIGVLLSSILSSSADERPTPQVQAAAQQGIEVFLNHSKVTGLDKIGFATREDIQEASLAEGFRVFTVPPEKLLKEQSVKDFRALSAPLDQWQFIVAAREAPKALITVELTNGVWTPVSIGSAGLAQQLRAVTKSWPASEGYTYRLIRIYQARSEFIELSKGDRLIGIIPMISLHVAIGDRLEKFDPLEIRDPGEIISDLRQVVKDSMGVEK